MRISNTQGTLNSRQITGNEVRPNDRFGYKIIAVIYSDGRWCAYRGFTEQTDDEIAAFGDEVLESVARSLFPTIANNVPVYENV